MKLVSHSYVMRMLPWIVPLLTLAIFLLDIFTPVGVAVSMLYVLPLLFTFVSPSVRAPLYFASVVTGLIWLDLLLKPPGIPIPHGVFNRALATFVMWGVAVGLTRYKGMQRGLRVAEVARDEAVVSREAAVEARALSEAAATGAIHRESQTARELLMSSLRLESILHSAMDAIVTIDERQHVLLFNQAAERMFQCPAREAIGQSLDKFIPPRFRASHHQHVEGFGRSGVTSRKMGALGTIGGLRANGEEFPLEAAISNIVVEGKKFYTVILRDITERKRAEQLMRQSEERYRRLIAVSPYGILVYRGDRIIFANDRAIKLFGAVKADEVVGKSPFEFFHSGCHAPMRARITQLMEGGQAVPPVEERVVALDGTPIDVEVSAARFADEEGAAILVMLRDISERKRLQDQLKRTERIAELGTLASGMAHEIGTPMNVILGRAEYLMDRVAEEPIKKGLQTIIIQVERITKVMNQLLSFARRKAPERQALDLWEVIEASVEIFQERLSRNRIEARLTVAEACPKVLADADQMSQVLINLVMNALHAMPDGGTLTIRLEPDRDAVKLTVTDTGHGMPRETITKIFEPFFTTKEFGKGTGLGLTVVKGIIEEHQGSIVVDSEEGKGTTFTILLPKSG